MRGDRPALPPRLWIFLGGYLLSAVGSGVVAPFTAIYLTTARQFPLGTVSLVLAVIAAANIAGSVAGGWAIDRFGPRGVVVVSLVVQAAGYLALGLAASPGPALVAAGLVGVGGGGFYPTSVPILVALAPREARRRAFSLRSLVISLGTGIGSALGGQLVVSTSVAAFQVLFAANAVSYLVFGAVLAAVLGRTRPEPEPVASAARRGRIDRTLLLLLALQTAVVLAGYGQFTSSVPLLLQTDLATDAGLIGTLVAVGTVVVVLLQLPVGRLSEAHPPSRMLAVLGVVWAAAWACGLVAAATDGGTRTAALLVMAVLYGVGACLFQPNFQVLLAGTAPAGRLGRASGYASSAWGVALVVASPVGVLLAGAGAVALWGVLIALCAVVFVLARLVGTVPVTSPGDAPAPVGSSRR